MPAWLGEVYSRLFLKFESDEARGLRRLSPCAENWWRSSKTKKVRL
ncbi:MAG: hypothetical protein QW304_00565 [Thermoproteota archaeon]